MAIEETIHELESFDSEAQNQWLKQKSPDTCEEILGVWAHSISLENYASLELGFKTIVTDHLLGNPSKGISAIGRIFYIAPTNGTIRVQVGWHKSKHGSKRVYKKIDKIVPMPADVALSAMVQHGCLCKTPTRRFGLKEVSMEEMIQVREVSTKKKKRKPRKVKAKSTTSKEETNLVKLSE